jgi:hypothetical protein
MIRIAMNHIDSPSDGLIVDDKDPVLMGDIVPHIAAGMIPLGTGQMAIGIARRNFMFALGGATAWPLANSRASFSCSEFLNGLEPGGFSSIGAVSRPIRVDLPQLARRINHAFLSSVSLLAANPLSTPRGGSPRKDSIDGLIEGFG